MRSSSTDTRPGSARPAIENSVGAPVDAQVSMSVLLVAEAHGVGLHFLHGGCGVVELGRLLAPRRMSPSGLRLMLGSIC